MTDARNFQHLSGQDLAALRREAGLTQAELAQRAGIGRQTVLAWEKRLDIRPWDWAPRRIMDVLGVRLVRPTMSPNATSTRARGDGVLLGIDEIVARAIAHEHERRILLARAQAARRRVLCSATTRKGHACRLLLEPGRKRCKFHGGKSTGPKTKEGKERIAEAQRRRWAAWRARAEKAQVVTHDRELASN